MKEQIDQLAQLMSEFQLEEARLREGDLVVEFARNAPQKGGTLIAATTAAESADEAPRAKPRSPRPAAPVAQAGTPISSPMMGIFYSSPSPGSPAFVKEGDSVSAGQVVGLIEAMKVFNEITSTTAGKVLKINVESGQLVQPGEPLLYVG